MENRELSIKYLYKLLYDLGFNRDQAHYMMERFASLCGKFRFDDLTQRNRLFIESIIKNSGKFLPKPSEED